jgi:hypothetical protein
VYGSIAREASIGSRHRQQPVELIEEITAGWDPTDKQLQ